MGDTDIKLPEGDSAPAKAAPIVTPPKDDDISATPAFASEKEGE